MENKDLTKLQSTIMKEIDFYCNDEVDDDKKTERIDKSLTISKLISNYVQIENIKLRANQIGVNDKDVNRKLNKNGSK